MEIGIFAPLRSPVASPRLIARLGRGLEERGAKSIWLGEHVVMFADYDSRYPGTTDGVFRFPPRSGLLDMTATIGYLAAHTTRLRLGTGIRILPQANPVYTAKEYATLDFISEGRIDLGVGVGWSWEEFEACAVPWGRRGARCDEYLEILRTLWCDEVSRYQGEFYQLRECLMYPKPVQQPMVPVTVGGHSAGALKRAARFGSGWYGINLDPEAAKQKIAQLNGCLEAAGRQAGELKVTIGATSYDLGAQSIGEYAAAGVDQVLVPYLRQSEKWLERFLDDLQPYLDAADAC